jgi:hypothetical protein
MQGGDMSRQKTWIVLLVAIFLGTGCAPDLVVDQVNIDWTAPTKSAQATITNIGNQDAGEFLVYFNGDEFPMSRNRRPQIRHTVAGLGAGASITLAADFTPLAHPDNNDLGNVYGITVLADPKNMVSESDEENNSDRGPTIVPVVELHDSADALVPANPTPLITTRIPILFVHGHNLNDALDQSFNYRKNWQQPLDYGNFLKLPSFKIALDLPQNANVEVEPYYIRFQDQNRSITEDAAEIGEAVSRILRRHDQPGAAQVKVVIIAYSKGTMSTRWYLNSLMPASQPVSEFIAISPPNHGLQASTNVTPSSLALRQLNNGFDDQCGAFNEVESMNFIETLNGHAIADTMTGTVQGPQFDREAPGSRADGAAPDEGVLYVALYANNNRDVVGGGAPSGDCQGRVVARNLAQDAENIEVSQIPGLTDLGVHANAVHTPEVICLALHAAIHHGASAPGLSCATQTVDGRQVPVIPLP